MIEHGTCTVFDNERDQVCGEPGLINGVCYDHAKVCKMCDTNPSDPRTGQICSSCDDRKWGRCPRCLAPRPGNDDHKMGLSFAPPCWNCEYRFIPEELPRYHIHICPYCFNQGTVTPDHNLGGGDDARCTHAHPGERGISHPKMIKVEVEIVAKDHIKPLPIPHDRIPEMASEVDDGDR